VDWIRLRGVRQSLAAAYPASPVRCRGIPSGSRTTGSCAWAFSSTRAATWEELLPAGEAMALRGLQTKAIAGPVAE
jgi:hypothetical protein